MSLAKVDATENEALKKRFEIKGFPTLFWFSGGKHTKYDGGRTKDTIVSWIKKNTGPPSTIVTCDQLKETTEKNKFVMAYFGAVTTDLHKEFYEFAVEE
jgi:protein disulfide-isomerase A1